MLSPAAESRWLCASVGSSVTLLRVDSSLRQAAGPMRKGAAAAQRGCNWVELRYAVTVFLACCGRHEADSLGLTGQ